MLGSKFAQSAMEYLMTYGWAILVIAVVLGALFGLGVFNASAGLGTGCTAQSGFSCGQPVLSTNGVLSVTIGQTTQQSVTITNVGCSPSSAEPSTWTGLRPTITLQQGQTYPGLDFQCPVTSNSLGSSFTGTLWIEYTTTQYPGITVPVEIGTISAREQVVSGSGGGGMGGGGGSLSSSSSSSSSTTTVTPSEANISLELPLLSGGTSFEACSAATYNNTGLTQRPSVNFTFGGQDTATTFVGQLAPTGPLCTAQILGTVQSNSGQIPVIAGIELPDDPTISSAVVGTNANHTAGETDGAMPLYANYTVVNDGSYVVAVYASSDPGVINPIQNFSIMGVSNVFACIQEDVAPQEAWVYGGVENAGSYTTNIIGADATPSNASIAIWVFSDANAILNAPAPVTVADNATWWYC